MTKPKPAQEKRRAKRVKVSMPAKVRVGNGATREFETKTRDISSNGIYLYTDGALREGSQIEIVAMLPPEITHAAQTAWVCCHARVVRVESVAGEGHGIAAVIERFGVVPEA